MLRSRRPKPLIVILGPTGVGKTQLSLSLAAAIGGEIVSADSRQVYVGMDIGTAKPTSDERRRVPHHLVDILTPDQRLSVAEFRRKASDVIENLHHAGTPPIMVGGSGQYIRAVVEGWAIPQVPASQVDRAKLEAFAAANGCQALYDRLARLDPQAAASIDPRNVRRVVRALEVITVTGQPFSAQKRRDPPPYSILQIGLTLPRPTLYRIVDSRIDRMLEIGWLDEVRALVAAGYDWSLPALSSLGYGQLGSFLRGECSMAGAVAGIRRATRNFIRKQYNWFRLTDSAINWFDVQDSSLDSIVQFASKWLGE